MRTKASRSCTADCLLIAQAVGQGEREQEASKGRRCAEQRKVTGRGRKGLVGSGNGNKGQNSIEKSGQETKEAERAKEAKETMAKAKASCTLSKAASGKKNAWKQERYDHIANKMKSMSIKDCGRRQMRRQDQVRMVDDGKRSDFLGTRRTSWRI